MGRDGRGDKADKHKFPGAGTYEQKSRLGEAPKFVMGSKLGSSLNSGSKVPGPGSYQPEFKDKGSSYSIRLKTNFGTSLEIRPDGTHEKIMATTGFAPGPGAYEPKKNYPNRNDGQRWGHDARGSMADPAWKVVPAANKYNNHESARAIQRAAPCYGFGTSKRPTSSEGRHKSPGPGNYEIKGRTGYESQGKSLGLKLKTSNTTNLLSPGPGTYNETSPDTMMRKAAGWKIGTSMRGDHERSVRKANYPPPGTHNPDFKAVASKSAAWGFGSSTRPSINQVKATPGAGKYEIPSKVVEGPAFHMGLKLENHSAIGGLKNPNPAPNNYDNNKFGTVKN